MEFNAPIIKTYDKQQIVYGVVIEPGTIKEDDIENTAHKFLKDYITINNGNKKINTGIVESYIAPVDFVWNDQQIKKGSWIIGARILDKNIWRSIKNGDYAGFSITGN